MGKTAIAEGLALRIAEQQVPAKLFGAEVYLLDMTAIVAGTQFRGQFEGRIKSIVDEAKERGNVILVIDELHNIVGAGDLQGGAMNAANILKPAWQGERFKLLVQPLWRSTGSILKKMQHLRDASSQYCR